MSSWLKLANKTAIVTGGSSGIGAAVVKALASEDCRVISADHRPASASENAISVKLDVTKAEEVRDLFEEYSNTSILVNCAGITRDVFMENMSMDDWENVMNVNLTGTFRTCQAFCQLKNKGSIVNLGSVVSQFGNLGQTNYAASKGGVLGLTRALAKEMAPKGIRVNAVLPGFIDTPMTQVVPASVKDRIVTKIPLGSFGKPSDVANLVLFLASCERSRYITGECIQCSGMISL